MSVSGILGWLNIRGGDLFLEMTDEAYAGSDALMTVRFVNRRRYLPSFLLKIRVAGGEVDFDMVDCRGEARRSLLCRFPERGEHRIARAVMSSPFPVNFFVRSRTVPVAGSFLVFPAPVRAELTGDRDQWGKEGGMTQTGKGYEGDVAKITDYSGTDPLRLVHWRLSAKHDELKVKELSSHSQTPVILDIDTLGGYSVEENLSRATYLVNTLIRSNRPVGLKLPGGEILPAVSCGHRLRLLSELALHGKH